MFTEDIEIVFTNILALGPLAEDAKAPARAVTVALERD